MRDSSRQPGSGRRQRTARRSAALVAVLLAGLLGLAACSASGSNDDSASSKAAAPGAADRSGQGASGGSGSGRSSAEGGEAAPTQPAQPSKPGSGAKAAPKPTYMVRTADLSVRTPHVADALARAKQYADSAGGYAGDEDTEVDSAGRTTSRVQLRVPPAQYESVLDELAGLGTLLSREVNVKDVTGQVVDVQSRIKSQRASVDRVRKLMDQATDLNEVVSLESELSTREAALESLEAQQASLEGQTDLATVTLELSEPPAKAKKPAKKHHDDGFWTQVGHGLGDGWHGFYLAMRTVLVVLAVLLPFLALFVLLVWVSRLVRRRWFPRREPAAPPAGPSGALPLYPQAGVREPWLTPPAPQVPPQAPGDGEEPPPAG